MISLALAAIAFLIFSYWANQLLLSILPRPVYLAVMFPGVVIHEASHLLFAVVTATPVSEVKFFSSTGGHVIHGQPRIPVLGQFVISFAPLVVGITIIYFLLSLLPLSAGISYTIPYSTFAIPVPGLTQGWGLINLVWIYLILSISLTLMPSKQDVLSSLAGVLVLAFVIGLLYMNNWLTIPAEIISIIWYINISLAIIVLILLPIKTVLKIR